MIRICGASANTVRCGGLAPGPETADTMGVGIVSHEGLWGVNHLCLKSEDFKVCGYLKKYRAMPAPAGMCLALVRQRLIPSTGGVPAGRGGSDIGNRLHQPTPSPLPGGDTIPG